MLNKTTCCRLLKYGPVIREKLYTGFYYRVQSTSVSSCLGTTIRRYIWIDDTGHTFHMKKKSFLGLGSTQKALIQPIIYQQKWKQFRNASNSQSLSESTKNRKLQLLKSAGYCGGLLSEEFYDIDSLSIVKYIKTITEITWKFVYISPELIVFVHNNIRMKTINNQSKERILAKDLVLRQKLVAQSLECQQMFLRRHEKYLPLHHSRKNNVQQFLERLELLLQEGLSLVDIRTNIDIMRFSKERLKSRIEKLKEFKPVAFNCSHLKMSYKAFMKQRYKGFDILYKARGVEIALDADYYAELAKEIGVRLSDSFVTRVHLLRRLGFSFDDIRGAHPSVFDHTIAHILPLAIEHLKMQNVSGSLISRTNSSILHKVIEEKRIRYSKKARLQFSGSNSILLPKETADNMDKTFNLLKDLGYGAEDVTFCLPILAQSHELIMEGHENLVVNDKIPVSIRENKSKLINALNYEIEKLKRKKLYDVKYSEVDHQTEGVNDINDEDEDDSYIKELQVVLSDEENELP